MTKSNAWTAFRTALVRASRYRWVVLIMFVANLSGALLLTVLPAWSLADGLGHRPAIHQAAGGVDAWLVFETLMSANTSATLTGGSEAASEFRLTTLLAWLSMLALPFVAGLPAAFLGGGVLLTFAEAPAPFRWRRFVWGCWHWWGSFLLLSAVQVLVSTLFVPLTGALVGAVTAVGGWLAWILAPPLALLALLWLALVEFVRVAAIVGQTRNVFQALAGALRFVLSGFRNLVAVLGFYVLALSLLGLLHALYRWGLMPRLPLEMWPLVLVVQQTFILARLWARLVRMAGGVALYRERINR